MYNSWRVVFSPLLSAAVREAFRTDNAVSHSNAQVATLPRTEQETTLHTTAQVATLHSTEQVAILHSTAQVATLYSTEQLATLT